MLVLDQKYIIPIPLYCTVHSAWGWGSENEYSRIYQFLTVNKFKDEPPIVYIALPSTTPK